MGLHEFVLEERDQRKERDHHQADPADHKEKGGVGEVDQRDRQQKPVQTLTGVFNMVEVQKVSIDDPTTGTGEGVDVVGGKFSIELPVGTYTIWAYGLLAGHTKLADYWYAGDGVTPTTKSSKAVTFTLTEDGPVAVVFGAPPA